MSLAPTAHAAAPLAGAVIGNQASATYTDASQVSRIATSNVVQTIVQQVSSLTLSTPQTKMAAPGQTVYFPHTLTNTGNGTDNYDLTATKAGAFNFSSIVFYADANGDGVPDNSTPITNTGNVSAGGVFRFVAAGLVPGSATSGQQATITVKAEDKNLDGGMPFATNDDVVEVTGNAVIAVTKALSQSSGPSPSGLVTVTLTYTNTGNTTATGVTVTDVIGTADTAGMVYVDGTATWNGSTVTDADDTDVFKFAGTPVAPAETPAVSTGTATFLIPSVAPNVTGVLRFQIKVKSGEAPGTARTTNTAQFSYDANGATAGGATGPVNTNPASYRVLQTGGVVANDVVSSNDTDGSSVNDTVFRPAVPQGSTVVFDDVVHNTGNGTDTFNITVAQGTFPAGTNFLLYKADGVTPLVDTNGDSTPDTGPIAAGGEYHVIIKAVLPASYFGPGTDISFTMTATSVFDSTQSDPVTNTLDGVDTATVDLRNNNNNTDGSGAGTATPVTILQADPGASVTFMLQVNNTSLVADSYNLSVSGVPAGWSVAFRPALVQDSCATVGPVITNTGVINGVVNPGAVGEVISRKTVCAVVTVAADAAATPATWSANQTWPDAPVPGTFPGEKLTFSAVSPTTSATDTKVDGVFVNTKRGLSVLPNNAGQVFPGGTVVYSHTLANTGNVAETAGTVDIADSLAAAGWSSVVYWDVTNNGLDASDPVLTNISQISGGLSHKESARIYVKVFAPGGAGIGDIDLSTVTVTATVANVYGVTAPPAATVQDTTSVIAGQVRLVKEQALDVNCDGAESTYSNAPITNDAVPGVCLKYRITAINEGTAAVNTLQISDATPVSTTYFVPAAPNDVNCAAALSGGGVINLVPANGSAGTIKATRATLAPGASTELTFCVKIDN